MRYRLTGRRLHGNEDEDPIISFVTADEKREDGKFMMFYRNGLLVAVARTRTTTIEEVSEGIRT